MHIFCILVATHHCTGNTQSFKLLAVVGARLGAVICHENHLLSCRAYELCWQIHPVAGPYHFCAIIPMSRRSRGRGDHRTRVLLNDNCLSCCCDATIARGDRRGDSRIGATWVTDHRSQIEIPEDGPVSNCKLEEAEVFCVHQTYPRIRGSRACRRSGSGVQLAILAP